MSTCIWPLNRRIRCGKLGRLWTRSNILCWRYHGAQKIFALMNKLSPLRVKPMRLFDHTILLTDEILVQVGNSKFVVKFSVERLRKSNPYLCHQKRYSMGIFQFIVETKTPANVVIWTLKKSTDGHFR